AGPRSCCDQDRFRAQLAFPSIAAGDHDGAVSLKGRLPFDVVDMIPGDVLSRCFLQEAADFPGPLSDDVDCNLRWRRGPQTVDTSFAKPGEVERCLSKRLGRHSARRGYGSTWPRLFNDSRTVAKEVGQFGRAFSGGTRADGDEFIRIRHRDVPSNLTASGRAFQKRL